MSKDRSTPEEFLKNYKISLGLNRLDKLVDARVKNVMEEYAIQQDAINKDRIIEILKEKLSNRGLYQDHLISDQKLLDEIATAIQQESVGSSQSVTNCNQLKLLESIAIWLTSCVNDHYESGAQSDLDAVELWITQLASGQQESLKDTLIGFWEWMDDIDLKDKKNHSLEDFVDSFIKAHHLSGLPPKPTEI